jgi:hypothetical protein
MIHAHLGFGTCPAIINTQRIFKNDDERRYRMKEGVPSVGGEGAKLGGTTLLACDFLDS